VQNRERGAGVRVQWAPGRERKMTGRVSYAPARELARDLLRVLVRGRPSACRTQALRGVRCPACCYAARCGQFRGTELALLPMLEP